MTVTVSAEAEAITKRVGLSLYPLAAELTNRTDFAHCELLPYSGVVVARFVRGDRQRYDHAIGLKSLAFMAESTEHLTVGVNRLIRRAQERLSALLSCGLGAIGEEPTLAMVFEHPSWPEIAEDQPIPDFVPQFAQYRSFPAEGEDASE